MRKSTLFWGIVLILIGFLLLVGNILNVNAWDLIWPLVLIGFGVWMLWGIFFGRPSVKTEEAAIPLEGARQARVHVRHGAGRLRVDGSASAGNLAAGTFGGGLDRRVKREGDTLDVEMRLPVHAVPAWFPWPGTWGPAGLFDWTFGLSREVPLSLNFETGAGEARLDLTDLRVTDLRLQTGASATEIILPAGAGHTRAEIRAGAASVAMRVPDGVAARIRARGGLAGVSVNRNRFPRTGDVYQSADYDTAANKVEIDAEIGAGSIDIR
jgi:hypothetical protein